MKSVIRISSALILSIAGAFALPAHGVPYTITTIDVPGFASNFAADINNTGSITGGAYNSQPFVTGYILQNGVTFSFINVPGNDRTVPLGINNDGAVAGVTQATFASNGKPFTYSPSPPTYTTYEVPPVPGPGGDGVYLTSGGTLYGHYTEINRGRAFSLSGGIYTIYLFPGSDDTYLNGANDAGQFVGGAYLPGDPINHAFYSDGVSYNLIAFPGADSTQAADINNNGLVVGNYVDSLGVHGFFYDTLTNQFTTISGISEVVGPVFQINGLNDNGQIVGTYTDSNGVDHGFFGTLAVPEPTSLALLGLAIAGIWASRLRRS